MPAPGDQHSGIANPFEEPQARMSEFTAAQIATLQSRLEKQLGPEYLSSRSGPSGQKVHYIAAEKIIALANEVFGFNGWSSSIQNIQVDFVDENPQTFKISLGLSVIVRVTLKDGTYHEDIGYGHMENCKGKAAAFEKAKKEGTTDALKRALRNFGNVLGNCIYDKDYLAKVTKIKVGPTKFDEDNLYRHADHAKKETIIKVEQKAVAESSTDAGNTSVISTKSLEEEDFGDFDMADFGVTEDGHPDEVVLPGSHDTPQNAANGRGRPPLNGNGNGQPQRQPPPQSRPAGPRPPQTPNQRPTSQFQGRPPPNPQQQPHRPPNHASAAVQNAAAAQRNMTPPAQRPPNPNLNATNPNQNAPNIPADGPATFFSARAIKDVPTDGDTASVINNGAKVFDPKAESPSIRKTPGIDHKSSKPLSRSGVHVQPLKRDADGTAPGQASGPGISGGGFQGAGGNPTMSQVRQIGAPGGGVGSPLGNRGQYRPLTMKRPAAAPPDANGSSGAGGNGIGARGPLTEVSANGPGAGAQTGVDAKRQKMA
ncbi:hypothetical protein F5Y18DRAFT_369065 [Xylariaceae sp. FL1019]|nr:hypothetical protein F5Y18DRAFT_369065 [Xylariaceae sp. FL1019]